ncbi:MAG: hypothetical protein VX733_06635 [Candidatus Latescibacterota bacterium]|nr:hypothetical protein [Candidatus Latescibacterota bacterium]
MFEPEKGGRNRIVLFCLNLLCVSTLSCTLPFFGRARTGIVGPPSLRVDFNSASASANLIWERPEIRGFRNYRVERLTDSADFEVVAEVGDKTDTTHVDRDLLANTVYRYRIVTVFSPEKEGKEQVLASTTVEGGIHRFINSWSLPEDFLPTRIVIDDYGVLHVVGAGAGFVQRYDRGGNEMGRWLFSIEVNALLETATLDGPAVAIGPEGSVFVVYNSFVAGGKPRPKWAKFDADGDLLWKRPLETVFARHIALDGERIVVESISQLHEFDYDGELLARHPIPPLMVSSIAFWEGAFAALVEPLGFDTVGWQAPRVVVYTGPQRNQVERVYGRDPLSPEDRGAGLLHRPSDFAFDNPTNRVFVVNAGRDRIEVFRDQRYLTRWGCNGDGFACFDFSGKMMVLDDVIMGTRREQDVVAGGIARDRQGYVYVADTFNNRIQKFQP